MSAPPTPEYLAAIEAEIAHLKAEVGSRDQTIRTVRCNLLQLIKYTGEPCEQTEVDRLRAICAEHVVQNDRLFKLVHRLLIVIQELDLTEQI